MPRITSLIRCAIEKSHSIWSTPEPQVESENQTKGGINLESSLLTFQINLKK
jgi:hypothetical protein